ncbi:SRPBCC family protein [Leptospira johnsonii]|uniref:Glutathione S-transferase, N-terminal domain protein n=1 Tax=Leptospira johnsonii TaxID=1917820 RepID=A0A2P2D1K6_9LEPT|nr:SRPBCC domain-containing protein [Leptospira johnsonii]GBF38522.1 glutathione S-transferase, N-terminal domain protein [Leptospira johnsonii]
MKATDYKLEISQFIKANRTRVFEAWIRPELMKKWGCPKELTIGEIKMDFRVGGKYRTIMLRDEEEYIACGEYKEIIINEKLVFTHGWEGPEREETLVTVIFEDKDGGTEILLTHEKLSNESSMKGHREGWISTLQNLELQFK